MLYDDLVQPGEYICHHGVKGMKWGVRHDKDTTSDTIYFSTKKNKVPKLKFKPGRLKGSLSTTYKGKEISFFVGNGLMKENMDTTFKLIENWDNVNKMLKKGFYDVHDDIKTHYNVDMTDDSPSSFWVGGKVAVATYDSKGGQLDIEIDPVSYVIYSASFND